MTRDLATRVARQYSVNALGRDVRVAGVIIGNRAPDALVLLRARDGAGDYSLHVLGQEVIDECDADEFFVAGGVEDAR